MSAITAHIIETMPAPAVAAGSVALVCAAVGFVGWLALQHHVVKYGRLRFDRIVRASAVLAALVIGAAALPGSAGSQDRAIPVGLPDLISDPPFIWFNRTVGLDDGSVALVMSFDGYLRNNGVGVLELFGNPQIPGDVKQRWWDGESWIEVAAPRVLYETTDDHNHFHLMAAAEYELWDDGRTNKVGDSSKVGFCLLDSLVRTEIHEPFYDIVAFNYCEADNPDAEELRMGITPGWVDLYDANTTLQWVDISNTQPGWYWVGAIIDPEDQIVESDETNNGLVFSENKFAVTGYTARPLAAQAAGVPIRLKADAVGEVGELVWVVTEGPKHGHLDVPVGVDLFTDTVTYVATGDFEGVDSFKAAAHDLSSAFPEQPAEVTIDVVVGPDDASDSTASPSTPEAEAIASDVSLAATEWNRFELDFALAAGIDTEDEGLRSWYAHELPPGLRIDPSSGVISGSPTYATPGTASITLLNDDEVTVYTVPWTVERQDREDRDLDDLNDLSSPYGERLRREIGIRTQDGSYEATGLPEGASMSPSHPLLGGTPTEVGDFDVEIVVTVDGMVVDSTSFTWTVRPAAIPAFPL